MAEGFVAGAVVAGEELLAAGVVDVDGFAGVWALAARRCCRDDKGEDESIHEETTSWMDSRAVSEILCPVKAAIRVVAP